MKSMLLLNFSGASCAVNTCKWMKFGKFLYYRSLSNVNSNIPSQFCGFSSPARRRCVNTSNCTDRLVNSKPYFISTPIFYVNAVPHIGHLYTTVLADAISRWYRLLDIPVLFSTGTDEHGLKIQQASAAAKKDPKTFCDEVSAKFKDLFQVADIEYSDYIRTTEERHRKAVHTIWNLLYEKGYIYRGSYEGWYSTADEVFLSEDEVVDSRDPTGCAIKVSTESGHPVEWTKEENYMFRLSEFGERLTEWLNKKVIHPPNFEPILRSWIDMGLPDISVSRERSRLQWGMPVPGDDSQVIYVWLDALTNYLTVGGYPNEGYTWPADCHIVGKDILRFHGLYWPAFLMAAGLEPPKSILCHSHWTMDNQKMSKSKGNVVDPFDRIERYGSDGVRYFLLREGVPHADGNYSDERVVEVLNSELCNTLGNLLSRCTGKAINPEQVFPAFNQEVFNLRATEQDQEMWRALRELPASVDQHYREYNIYKAIISIMDQLRDTNSFLQEHKPWELKKIPEENIWLETVLHVAMETMRVAAILLQPVTPNVANDLLNRLNIGMNERTYKHLNKKLSAGGHELGPDIKGTLFPRIKS